MVSDGTSTGRCLIYLWSSQLSAIGLVVILLPSRQAAVIDPLYKWVTERSCEVTSENSALQYDLWLIHFGTFILKGSVAICVLGYAVLIYSSTQ